MRRLVLLLPLLAFAAAAETVGLGRRAGRHPHHGRSRPACPRRLARRRRRVARRCAGCGTTCAVRWTPRRRPPRSSRTEERTLRLVRGAVSDLERGETARGPGRPRERAARRARAARGALVSGAARAPARALRLGAGAPRGLPRGRRATTSSPGAARRSGGSPGSRTKRASPTPDPAVATAFVGLSTPHFRVHYDAALGRASQDYARTVLGYLEEAREATSQRLGAEPQEAMGVVFYGKGGLPARRTATASASRPWASSTGASTSSRPAHPSGELRALLFHEYTHAVFREHTGGDRPYWLNEGLAEVAERASHSRTGLTRSELVALRGRIDEGRWLLAAPAGAELLGPRRQRRARGLPRVDGRGRLDRSALGPRAARASARAPGGGGASTTRPCARRCAPTPPRSTPRCARACCASFRPRPWATPRPTELPC